MKSYLFIIRILKLIYIYVYINFYHYYAFMISMLFIQFILGILTIMNCFGSVPIAYGAMHQAGALILFAILLYVNYQFNQQKIESLVKK